jgi:hypothetical protein
MGKVEFPTYAGMNRESMEWSRLSKVICIAMAKSDSVGQRLISIMVVEGRH